MTTTKNPIIYTGNGSPVDNYFKPSQEPAEPKEENYAFFTALKPDPKKRKVLFSLMHLAQWTIPNEKYGEVPDLKRLSTFLQSDKSPVKKKLIKMDPAELEKIIVAFTGIVKSKYK